MILLKRDFDLLLARIRKLGYATIGPTVIDGAIGLSPVESLSDFPIGKSAEVGPGTYHLAERPDEAVFGYVVGAASAKRWLFPPRRTLFWAEVVDGEIRFATPPAAPPRTALIGLRACDLHAIAVQDKVFRDGAFVDTHYVSMRDRLLLVVVDCAEPASTCFCTSMGGDPAASGGYDLRLTELIDATAHRFVVEAGTPLGASVLEGLPLTPASGVDIGHRSALRDGAAQKMTKSLETDGLKELLYRNAEHAQWKAVADRCLACGNCTMVCPTCFCSNIEEVTEMGSSEIRRDKVWDSCFNEEFSYIHGGNVRLSTMSRYRQWMTHKLAAWQDQFDVIGCVGCGRCIAWCPVGIDITEEAAAIRQTDAAKPGNEVKA